jgi:hypothetical protein
MIRHPGIRGGNPATLEHCAVQIHAFDDELGFILGSEMTSYVDFKVAITGAKAYKTPFPVFRTLISGREVFAEQCVWAIDIESQQTWSNMSMRPVMEDFGKAVYFYTAFVNPLFLLNRKLVAVSPVAWGDRERQIAPGKGSR